MEQPKKILLGNRNLDWLVREYKVYFNVAFNTTLLVLAGLPMAFTRSEFNEQPAQQTE